jgi:hypothetical protein
MVSHKPDKKPDVKAAGDRGERAALLVPLVLGEGFHRGCRGDCSQRVAYCV